MTQPQIGIPRAMYNHYFYPFLKTFWQEVGFIPVFSQPTNRHIMDAGVQAAVDEACLPVKVFYGHVAVLDSMQLDYLLLPRYSAVENRTYLCPKSMGLPDMVRAEMNLTTPLIIPHIDFSHGESGFRQELYQWGKKLQVKRSKLTKAWQQAVIEQSRVARIARQQQLAYPQAIRMWEDGSIPPCKAHDQTDGITVGVLGHGYLTYDEQISLNLLPTLEQMGVKTLTPEMLSPQMIDIYAEKLPKKLFWSLGHNIMGAALAWQDRGLVDGIIHTTCFGCGPNSIVGEMLQHQTTRVPLLMLSMDEHTGAAGMQTRIEAFIDLLERKKRNAG